MSESDADQAGDRIIEHHGQWDWSLRVTPAADVVARRPIQHDGVLTFSTADRHVSDRARSETRLTVEEVLEQYTTRADTETPKVELLEQVIAALEDVRGIDDGGTDV
jgi:uncharacterized protein YcaQ